MRRLTFLLMGLFLLVAMPAWATNIDLSVSSYNWTPDPVVHGGSSTFSTTVTNNDAGLTASNLTLTIQLPANVDFSASVAPTNCTFNLVPSPKLLTCTNASLAAQGTWTVNFAGTGLTAGTANTTATITAAGNTDPNAGNDALPKTTTVINGADLSIAKTGPGGCVTGGCTTNAGSTISFNIRVTNSGPDPATTFRVTDNLPAATDFTYQSAAGAGWSCSQVLTTVTCDYSGAAVTSGNSAPDITVTGIVITSAGSITNGASVASTDGLVGDPVAGNNGPSQVVVIVNPGTSLRTNKTMVSAATGMTTYATGEAVTLTLSATNQGPQNATGVSIADTVPADFTISALPGGCSAAGQNITCTVGNLNNGATSANFVIPLTVIGAAGNSGTNMANISRATPAGGANTPASVSYTISAPFAHLTMAKSKGPNPVAAGANITNTITVTNANTSTSTATGTIRVTDVLDANETFVSFAGAGWSCSGVAIGATGTLTCDYAGANLARGASLPVLTITTTAAPGYLGSITNNACTGQSAGSPHLPADNSAVGNCQTATVTGSNRNIDLSITKTASIPAPAHILITNNSFSYTLTVANAGPDVAPTVTVTDPLAAWYNGNAGTTAGSAVITGAVGGESCSFGSTVICTLLNVTNGAPRTIIITLNRPFNDGAIANTATVSSPDAIDTVPGNNSWTANIIVDPIADVEVTNISDAPDPVKVGEQLNYTTSIKNNGPSTAAGVVLRHVIDPSKVTYVTGSASLTVGGNCSYVNPFVGAPYAGQAGIQCDTFSLTNGESRQLTFKVIPVYPYPGGVPNTYSSSAYITTTTPESDAPGYANNQKTNTANITQQALDLTVTDNDTGYDPTAFGDSIVYQVKAQNNGPSQATGFTLTVTPTAPVGGYSMPFNSAGSVLPGGAICLQPGGIGTNVICYLGGGLANSVLLPNTSQTFNLKFDTAGPIPASSITYQTTAVVSSYETDAGFDSLPGNNSVTETTTVLPKSDLILVSKAVSKPVVDINESFNYTVTVGNKGPSDASALKMTDALPAGLVMAGAVTVTPGIAAPLTVNSCTAPAVGSNGTVTCTLGPVPTDATGADATKQVVITIPVKAAYQSSGSYAFAFNTNIPNTATVATLPGVSLDTDTTNNSQTVNVQVRKNSIAGTVYADNNQNNTIDAGEGINSVTLTLTGTDSYGNTYQGGGTYPAITTTTVGGGLFTFDNLPPGTWIIVETQPAGYYDRFETAGTAGGTVPNAVCDGVQNCASSAAANTIGGITLPALTATAATGYIFQEYQRAQISGYVYHDANDNGVKDGGESGIAGVTVTLTGTAYNGVNVCTLVTCVISSDASGLYSYGTLPPSDATGYTVTETQPGAYLPGRTTAGTVTGTNSVAGTVFGGVTGNVIQGIKVYSNGVSINNNFGELQAATLSGYVFIDTNSNAAREGTETSGMTGVTITLTGTDDLGNPVNTSTTTAANGAYSFTGLRPGTYTVIETPPAGLTHTGAQVGSKGGSGQPALTAILGIAVTSITAIPIASNDSATDYNFGEHGQGLTGFVYADLNNNGIKDAGEPGIPVVIVTLSGTTFDNVTDVCTAINPNPCSVKTDASGAYSFIGLPASNAAGYTITEQSQAAPPLSNYLDGAETVGSLGGNITVNDRISAIVLVVGQFGTNYNFGERAGSITGTVYHDANDNGVMDGGESGIAGVTITLSGTTSSGANVCTVIPSCVTATNGAGIFSFQGLPSGTYTLTETQPVDYADRTTTAGSAGGAVTGTTISSIVLPAGVSASGYLFGEKLGSLNGFVFTDANNDGIKDPGDTGIGSVTLTLSGLTASGVNVCTTIPSCTTTTAADGSYSFSGLRNSNGAGYTITETQPGGYLDGITTKGKVNAIACAACNNSTANQISAIPFNAANTFTDYNFAELVAASLSGRIYHDANLNSSYDAGEELAGVTITLTGTDDLGAAVNTVTTTAADGTYSFPGLRPSNGAGYTITETQPNGIGNFPGNTGTQVGTISGVPTGNAGAGANIISAIVLPPGVGGINYNFRENASSFAGFVYLDANDNGIKDGGETGIAGVTITLTGTDANGAAVNRTTTTAADGSYSFIGLTSGTYTLTETQPIIYQDGRETAGTSGGTVDNTSFTFAAAQNRISAINLAAGTAATGYLFGERSGLAASLSGKVWYNSLIADQIQQAGEPGQQGWIVQIVRGGAVVATTTTAADGTYSFASLPPNTGYEVRFREPVNGALYGKPVSQDLGYTDSVLDYSNFTIANLTLRSGANITNQNLPIDPSGVVYNSITRAPVTGATVAIAGPPGFNAALHLAGGVANQTQITDATGFYQFLLLVGAPAGTYTLTITAPPGYLPAVSAIIPPTAGPFNPGAGPGNVSIQAQASPPTGAQVTTYYLSFTMSGASAGVIHNHVPLDPILGGAIRISKTTPLVNVSIGDLVPYTIEATNTLAASLPNIDLVDQVPPGFKYRSGSARLNGVAVEPIMSGRSLRWPNLTFNANEKKTLTIVLVVGAGVGEGNYTNQAWAMNNIVNTQVSNVGEAVVRIVPDPTFDCTDIIGKVFDDRNANGYQDEGEPGIPNVRIATARGWLVTTDAEGRFHVACAAIPQADRGSNFIMKLDERTLPSGFRMTTENPRVVRATRGKMIKLNFGATIHRVVRVEVSDSAFSGDGTKLLPDWEKRFADLPNQLREKPSVVRLAYRIENNNRGQAQQRIDHLSDFLRKRWEALNCCYPLSIEQELVEANR